MKENSIKPGYVYHITDSYFEKAKDDKLMRNHEGGAYRPTYLCVKDEKTQLLWVVPMSSQTEKYEEHIKKDIEKHGKCLKIVIGKYLGKRSAFLLQNMFPIIPKYISHAHVIKNIPVPVDKNLQKTIKRNFRELLHLHRNRIKIIFPDITRLEKLMIDELADYNENE
ncbi:MAG: hypothetical protein FWH08_00440 [Oscillospiraceae bacterium]|nr:hypothetical protein [Oscillospiraceae bacterium]